MARNQQVVLENEPFIAAATLAAANTARDGSGTVATLVTGITDGLRIDEIVFISAQATPAANTVMVGRVFLSLDAGATWNLFDEVPILAVTASNSAVGVRNRLTYPNGIKLEGTNHRIGVTISVYAGVQDRHTVIALGGKLAA